MNQIVEFERCRTPGTLKIKRYNYIFIYDFPQFIALNMTMFESSISHSFNMQCCCFGYHCFCNFSVFFLSGIVRLAWAIDFFYPRCIFTEPNHTYIYTTHHCLCRAIFFFFLKKEKKIKMFQLWWCVFTIASNSHKPIHVNTLTLMYMYTRSISHIDIDSLGINSSRRIRKRNMQTNASQLEWKHLFSFLCNYWFMLCLNFKCIWCNKCKHHQWQWNHFNAMNRKRVGNGMSVRWEWASNETRISNTQRQ